MIIPRGPEWVERHQGIIASAEAMLGLPPNGTVWTPRRKIAFFLRPQARALRLNPLFILRSSPTPNHQQPRGHGREMRRKWATRRTRFTALRSQLLGAAPAIDPLSGGSRPMLNKRFLPLPLAAKHPERSR